MRTKTKATTKSAAADAVKKGVKRARNSSAGGEIEYFLKEAKKFGAVADKKYVKVKRKARAAAKDLQGKAEELRDRAARKIDEWLQ